MPDIGNIGLHANQLGGLSAGYNSVGSVARATADQGRTAAPKDAASAARPETRDRVELSDHARFLATMRDLPPIRAAKVEAIRAQLEAGTYDVDGKLGVAIDRMVDEAQRDGLFER
jgi:flagellar biosynthesis anti-sigma factor FlgM